MHHDAGVAVDQHGRLVAGGDHRPHRRGHHLPDAAEEVARQHQRTLAAEHDVREAGGRAAAREKTDARGHRIVQEADDLPRIHGVGLDRILLPVLVLAGKLLLDVRGAIADVPERPLFQQLVEPLHTGFGVGLDVAVGGAAAGHDDVRPGIDLHVARLRIEIAVLGRVAVHARANGDHAIGLLEQPHGRARAIRAGDANVIVVLGEPCLCHQRGGDERPGALRELQHPFPRAGPPRTAAHEYHGLLGSRDDVRRLLERLGIGMHRPWRDQGGGWLVGLVIVLECLLLDVHRRAQHDRARLHLRHVKRLAHGIVRVIRRVEPHEPGFATGGEAGVIEMLVVILIVRRVLAAERHDWRSRAGGCEESGRQLRYARAASRGGDAHAARRACPAVGHPEPGAFVPNLEHLDPAQLVELVHPVHVRVAHDAEHVRDAFRLEIGCQPLVDLHAHSSRGNVLTCASTTMETGSY